MSKTIANFSELSAIISKQYFYKCEDYSIYNKVNFDNITDPHFEIQYTSPFNDLKTTIRLDLHYIRFNVSLRTKESGYLYRPDRYNKMSRKYKYKDIEEAFDIICDITNEYIMRRHRDGHGGFGTYVSKKFPSNSAPFCLKEL